MSFHDIVTKKAFVAHFAFKDYAESWWFHLAFFFFFELAKLYIFIHIPSIITATEFKKKKKKMPNETTKIPDKVRL